MTPHKLWLINRHWVTICGHIHCFEFSLASLPHFFNAICGYLSVWVNKVIGMVNGIMLITVGLHIVVCSLHVAPYDTSRSNPLLNDRDQCCSIVSLHWNEKTLLCFKFIATEYLLIRNEPPTIIFSAWI